MTKIYAPRAYRRSDQLTAEDLTAAGVHADDIAKLDIPPAGVTVVSAHNFRSSASILGVRDASGQLRMFTANPLPIVHLQGVGDVEGVLAGTLMQGNRLMWNYGYTTTVTAVRDVTERFVEIDQAGEQEFAGQTSTRRLRKDRLVARVTS